MCPHRVRLKMIFTIKKKKKTLPVVIAASLAQEVLRTRFMYLRLQAAVKHYPEVRLIKGAVKGNGYGYIKLVERCIRGKSEPKENDILQNFGKSAVNGSLTFLLHERGVIKAPIEIVTLAVVAVFRLATGGSIRNSDYF